MIHPRRLRTVLLTGMLVTLGTSLVAGSHVSAQQKALEPLVLYDDFNAPLINPNKWFGSENGPRSQLGDLPSPFGTEVRRDIVKDDFPLTPRHPKHRDRDDDNRQLRLAYRSYGSQDSDSDNLASGVRLNLPNPSAVTALAATITVKKAEVAGCATNPLGTGVRTRLFGFFFNTDTPTPGSPVNDVIAQIFIRANSALPGLEVLATVVQCADINCLTGPLLGSTDFGPIDADTPVHLLMQWDQAQHQFLFQRDEGEVVVLPYTVPDLSPPGLARKQLDITFFVPNCTSEPRPGGFVEARFDDVYVNQSAAPTP